MWTFSYSHFWSIDLSHFHVFRYCLADDRLTEAVKFLDLGEGAGWELLQVSFLSHIHK